MPNPSSPFYLQYERGITYLVDINGDREQVLSISHVPLITYCTYTEEELQYVLAIPSNYQDRTDPLPYSLPIDNVMVADDTDLWSVYDGSDQYDKCTICYNFSMLFGGSHKGRSIDNEEQFEIVKEEFVTHFNKCHKDIMEKRPEYKEKKFKKMKPQVLDIAATSGYNMVQTTPSFYASFYGSALHAGDIVHVDNIIPYDSMVVGTSIHEVSRYNQPPSWQVDNRTPEYEVE